MSKKKRPPEQGKDGRDEGKDYVEIPVPNLSALKHRVDESLETAGEKLVDRMMDGFSEDLATLFAEDRVGLDPSYSRYAVGFAVTLVAIAALMIWIKAPLSILAIVLILLLLCIPLYLLGKYEIRYDSDGFTVRLGKKELRRHPWTDVTDVRDGKKIYVQGKRLFADSSMEGFDRFYHRARVSCKGKGKTVLSEKKRRSRQKAPTRKKD